MRPEGETNIIAQCAVVQGLMVHSNNNPGVLNQTPHSWWCLHQVRFPHSSLLGTYIMPAKAALPLCYDQWWASCLVGSIANRTYPLSWKEATVVGYICQKLELVRKVAVTSVNNYCNRAYCKCAEGWYAHTIYSVRHTMFYLYVKSCYH